MKQAAPRKRTTPFSWREAIFRKRTTPLSWWQVAVLVLGAVGAGIAIWTWGPAEDPPFISLLISLLLGAVALVQAILLIRRFREAFMDVEGQVMLFEAVMTTLGWVLWVGFTLAAFVWLMGEDVGEDIGIKIILGSATAIFMLLAMHAPWAHERGELSGSSYIEQLQRVLLWQVGVGAVLFGFLVQQSGKTTVDVATHPLLISGLWVAAGATALFFEPARYREKLKLLERQES